MELTGVNSKGDIGEMLKKLDEMYDKEEAIEKQVKILLLQLKQLQEDKDLLQTIIMHQSNLKDRLNTFKRM